MKNKFLFIAVAAGFMLASCGVVRNNDFSARKYTKFHKGVASVTSDPAAERSESVKVESGQTADDIQNTDGTVISHSIAETQKEEKPVVMKTPEKNPLTYSGNVSSERKDVRLKSMQSKVLARLADKPNTTSANADVVLVILAIFLPPLAVALARGIGNEFWIDLLLTVLFFVPGMIYAILVVCDAI